jgi:dihydrofolate reductase
MARLFIALSQSLDGYVDHDRIPPPGPSLFRHFTDLVGGLTGSIYGRRTYEIMSYWEQDQPEWGDAEHAFAAVWRRQPKWVVSRTLTSVGPNATLITCDVVAALAEVKARHDGDIEIAGPVLAHSLAGLGLIDAYHLYLRPVVLGHGAPFFPGAVPPLRLEAHDLVGEDAIRLIYAPA